jgi:hypothetical protein
VRVCNTWRMQCCEPVNGIGKCQAVTMNAPFWSQKDSSTEIKPVSYQRGGPRCSPHNPVRNTGSTMAR